jgi:hypothetical protein
MLSTKFEPWDSTSVPSTGPIDNQSSLAARPSIPRGEGNAAVPGRKPLAQARWATVVLSKQLDFDERGQGQPTAVRWPPRCCIFDTNSHFLVETIEITPHRQNACASQLPSVVNCAGRPSHPKYFLLFGDVQAT